MWQAQIDGVEEMENLLIMGLTNRRDLIDEALLRPGRLEVQLEIRPPDAAGRLDILRIHLRRLRNTGRLDPAVWERLEGLAGRDTAGLSGAQLAGLVRSAASFALDRVLHPSSSSHSSPTSAAAAAAAAGQMQVELRDVERALVEIRQAAPTRWWSRVLRWAGFRRGR